jgi:hypothetical protein
MVELWEEHLSYEFEAHSTEKTLSTMTEDPVNINVPLLTGGVGVEEVRRYYSEYFIPKNPPDTEVSLLSRTVGEDRLVDELIQKFTHTIELDYMLPGIPRPEEGWRFRWLCWLSFGTARLPQSTSTRIKPRFWCRLGCSTRILFPW